MPHVVDLLVFGTDAFRKRFCGTIKKDYQIRSNVDNEAMFCGQRFRWQGNVLMVGQDKTIDEIIEITLEEKNMKDDLVCPPLLHTEYRRTLARNVMPCGPVIHHFW